jgi:hypothetical protein
LVRTPDYDRKAAVPVVVSMQVQASRVFEVARFKKVKK